ncbi:unnamed protein product [Ambrosiozyma monospora]|uniref:Class E vacuolar protein-sorting machinery protein HSE1 n=1 Tax=Ambrosiozyma monospora TaxID=43982 RepID=A0A9W6WLI2_AMBMO|nr:unnamed protein product [Ambrosiozyma monospora]
MSLEFAIERATSAELTEDDWGQLLDIVDLVKSNPDEYIPESISVVKSRLNSGNANVILRTITLIDFLAENCGAMMKLEISEKSFVNDNLVKLVRDNYTYNIVRYAIIKEIYKLSKSFKGDQSLRIMEDTFNELKTLHQYLCEQAVSEVDIGTNGPDTAEDENEKLSQAIELSLKESQGLPSTARVMALYDFESADEDILSFKKDNIISIVETINVNWLRGCLNGKVGMIPVDYVKKIPPTTDQQLQQLITTLNRYMDIRVFLSQLMDLSTKHGTTAISNQEFEAILKGNGISACLNEVENVKETLKEILDLYQVKILELQSMSSNADSDIDIYNNLLAEHAVPTTAITTTGGAHRIFHRRRHKPPLMDYKTFKSKMGPVLQQLRAFLGWCGSDVFFNLIIALITSFTA